MEVFCLMADDPRGLFHPGKIPRRKVGKEDVNIDIHYCGICHSDYHSVKAEWGGSKFYPMVPGHEIVGVVNSVGENVKKFKPGDRVGVGCFVNSCRTCSSCKRGLENYCLKGMLQTYNSEIPEEKVSTFGGYSESIVVDQNYVLKVPDSMDLSLAGPILCAGITMYSALKNFSDPSKKQNIAIIGLGGLGEMGARLAKAMGHNVTVISSSDRKREFATSKLGVNFVASSNKEEMKSLTRTIDLALSTIPVPYDWNDYFGMMAISGNFCCIGAPPKPFTIDPTTLIFNRLMVSGSVIGGIKETQEVLDFCAEKKIFPTIELISASANDVLRAFVHLGNSSSSSQRFVIDMRKRSSHEADKEAINLFKKDSQKHHVSPAADFRNSFKTDEKLKVDYAGKTYDPESDKFK